MIKNALMGLCLLVAGVLVFGGGIACSVLDGDDRADLEQAIDKEPAETKHSMASMAMRAKTRHWLDGRPPNERVSGVECWHWTASNPNPTEPRIEQDLVATVADVLACMDGGLGYSVCTDKVMNDLVDKALVRWQVKKDGAPAGSVESQTETQCIEVIDPQFLDQNVPGAEEDLNRVTAGEIVEWLLGLSAPPAGFSAGAWETLLPFICALDVSWGCPGDPHNPGLPVTITPAPSGGSGGTP